MGAFLSKPSPKKDVPKVLVKDNRLQQKIWSQESIKDLLESGVSANSIDKEGRAPLHTAAFMPWADDIKEVFDLLIQHGADVNQRDNVGMTPLHCAAVKSHIYAMYMCVENGAIVDAVDFEGETPLYIASSRENIEVAKILVKHGADVNKVSGNNNPLTPVQVAAKNNNLAVVELLVRAGADTSVRDSEGNTLLHLAAVIRTWRMAEFLIEHAGGKINAKNNIGKTPLHVAADNGISWTVEGLVKCGADVNIVCDASHTALDCARMAANKVWINQKQAGTCVRFLGQHIAMLRAANMPLCKSLLNDPVICSLTLDEAYKTEVARLKEIQSKNSKLRKAFIEKVDSQRPEKFKLLPFECLNEIMSYLSNEELEIFANSL